MTLTFDGNLKAIVEKLKKPLGSNQWLLTKSALVHLLNRFIAGEVESADVFALTNALEMNESILYEPPFETAIADALFLLSTPEVNGVLTAKTASSLIEALTNVKS
jgi:hypothetical protein